MKNYKDKDPALLGRFYRSNSEFKRILLIETSFLDVFPNIIPQQRIYHFVTSLKEVPLCYCGNPLRYSTARKYLNSCGSKECVQKHSEKIMFSKYGVDNYAKTKEYKEKCKSTCLKNYGVEYPTQSKKVQEKIKETNLEKYGSEWQPQSNNFKEKSKKTWIKNYGVDNPSKDSGVQQKKVITSRIRYGTDNPSQNVNIFNKIMNTSKTKKVHILKNGKSIKVAGYEGMAIDLLLDKYSEDDIIYGNSEIEKQIGRIFYEFEGKNKRYFPDIYIKSENKIMEVKSSWTYEREKKKNLLKEKFSKIAGLNFEFMILPDL